MWRDGRGSVRIRDRGLGAGVRRGGVGGFGPAAIGLDAEAELDVAGFVEFFSGGSADHGREATPDELGDEGGRNGDLDMIVVNVEARLAAEVTLKAGGAEFAREAVAEPAHAVVVLGARAGVVLAGRGGRS